MDQRAAAYTARRGHADTSPAGQRARQNEQQIGPGERFSASAAEKNTNQNVGSDISASIRHE